MNEVAQCGAPGEPTPVRRKGKTAIVDIHCHLSVPAGEAMLSPYAAASSSLQQWTSAASDAVNRAQFQQIGKTLASIDHQIIDMDARGIDIQVLSPMPGQLIYAAPAEPARDAARTINDGIAEAVSRHPARLAGMGLAPMQSPELAIAEMKRCVKELGLRGIEISSHVNGKELSAPELRPFFAAAEELGVLLFLHPLGFTHGERLREHYFNNILGNPIDSTIAVAHLIFDGVLAQLPGLKICVAHGGGYLPSYTGRMDHAWRTRADCRQHISKPPSEYLKQLYFDTLVFDRAHLDFLIEKFGADHLCLGTDYPFDMGEPDPLGAHAHLSESDHAKVCGGNAARLLGLADDFAPS